MQSQKKESDLLAEQIVKQGQKRHAGWKSRLVVLAAASAVALSLTSCSKKEEPKPEPKAPEPKPAPAPAPVAKAEPAPAPQVVEAPKVEEAKVEEPKKEEEVVVGGVKANVLADGTKVFQMENGARVVVYPDQSMKTFLGDQLLLDQPIVDVESGSDGSVSLTYADGTKAQVGPYQGVIDLGCGFIITLSAGGQTTSWNGLVLTKSPFSAYDLKKDGVREITYADGIKVRSVPGMVAVSIEQGLTIQVDQEGEMETSFNGLPITRAKLVDASLDDSLHLTYGDGMKADLTYTGATIALANGLGFVVDMKTCKTQFLGKTILESPIESFALDEKGDYHIAYQDGKKLDLGAAGSVSVSLPEGLSVALEGGKARTTYLGVVVSESPITDFSYEDGYLALTYADGSKVGVGANEAGMLLSNGFGVMTNGQAVASSVNGMILTDANPQSYSHQDGKREISYADGMKVTSEDAGPLTVVFPNGVTIAAQSLDTMRTFWQDHTLSVDPVDLVVYGQHKEHAVHYNTDAAMLILADGSTAFALPNGLVFATDGSWCGTALGNMELTESPFSDYAFEDGKRTVTYADGMKLVVEKEGAMRLSLPEGVTLAISGSDCETSYGGLVVSKSPLVGFATTESGRQLVYGDGMNVLLASDGSITASYPNGVKLVAGSTGMVTSFLDVPVTTAAVTGYTLSDDGSKTLTYADGLKLDLASSGALKASLPGGVEVAYDGKSCVTSFDGLVVTRSMLTGFKATESGREFSYADGLVATLNADGTASVGYPEGLKVTADASSVLTTYMDAPVTASAITAYGEDGEGTKTIGYSDGMEIKLEGDGDISASLPSGVEIAYDGKDCVTSYDGVVVTKSPLVAFAAEGDKRAFSYADGMVAVLGSEGVSVKLANGVGFSYDGKDCVTSYAGLVVSRSPLISYDDAPSGRTLGYADGMTAFLGSDGSAVVGYPDGLKITADANGLVTTYDGGEVTRSGITSFSLASDGSRTIGYGDGKQVRIDAQGHEIVEKKVETKVTLAAEVKKPEPAPAPKAEEPAPVVEVPVKVQPGYEAGLYGSFAFRLTDSEHVLDSSSSGLPSLGVEFKGKDLYSLGDKLGLGFDAKLGWIPDPDKGWDDAFDSGYDHFLDLAAQVDLNVHMSDKATVNFGVGPFLTTDFSDVSSGIQAGIGVDYELTDQLTASLGQDLRYSFSSDSGAVTTATSIGLRYRF